MSYKSKIFLFKSMNSNEQNQKMDSQKPNLEVEAYLEYLHQIIPRMSFYIPTPSKEHIYIGYHKFIMVNNVYRIETVTGTNYVYKSDHLIHQYVNNVTVEKHMLSFNPLKFIIPKDPFKLMNLDTLLVGRAGTQEIITKAMEKQMKKYGHAKCGGIQCWYCKHKEVCQEEFETKCKEAYDTLKFIKTEKLHKKHNLKVMFRFKNMFHKSFQLTEPREMLVLFLQSYFKMKGYKVIAIKGKLFVQFNNRVGKLCRFLPNGINILNVRKIFRTYETKELVRRLNDFKPIQD